MSHHPCASSDSAYSDEERRNRDVVLAFYERGVNRHDVAAALSCVDPGLIQHKPYIADGTKGLSEYFTALWKTHAQFRVDVKRIYLEGELAAAHVLVQGGSEPNGEAAVDIFRLKNGKIVEQWGVIRPIPSDTANANSMFYPE